MQVGGIEEQCLVALVSLDVVNHGGGLDPSVFQAHAAERFTGQVDAPHFLPAIGLVEMLPGLPGFGSSCPTQGSAACRPWWRKGR